MLINKFIRILFLYSNEIIKFCEFIMNKIRNYKGN